ncbi:MAG: hypothetical protein RLZZ401_742 [Pseudomonadota bacterium]|jgi:glutaredoxin
MQDIGFPDLRGTLCRSVILLFAGVFCTLAVQGQTVYRAVGTDGRVTFSDRPSAEGRDTSAGARGTGATAGNPPLSYELRQIVTRYPVTLYTAAGCGPCIGAKALLMQRGVPFTERTVASSEDQNEFQRISGDTTLPFGTIGTQQLKGFSSQEWAQYLDAASYPAQSQLPRGYVQPEASPLVASVKVAAPAASASATETSPGRPRRPTGSTTSPAQAPASADPKANPAGIRF